MIRKHPRHDLENPPGQTINRLPGAKLYKPTHGGYPNHDHVNPDGTEMVPNNVLDTEEMFTPSYPKLVFSREEDGAYRLPDDADV